VPDNGLTTDFDHRLGSELCLLAHSRTEASSKNDGFHFAASSFGP
jgi:hypothetical protein